MAPLSSALALRIALAARELNGVDTAHLVRAIIACAGEPINEARLAKLRTGRLRLLVLERSTPAAVSHLQGLGTAQWQKAVDILKGRGVVVPIWPLPEVVPYHEGDMPDSVRIACASDGGAQLDAGFSACARFLIYQVSPQEIRLIGLREAGGGGGREDRLVQRATLISDCQLLYTLSIGGPAAAKVVRAGVYPIKVEQPVDASLVARELQEVLAKSPPPWLAKVMGAEPQARRRFVLEGKNE